MCFVYFVVNANDGYVAYPAGIQGVIVGQGDTFEAALHDVQSAIRFHIETFGKESLEMEDPALDAFVAGASRQLRHAEFPVLGCNPAPKDGIS